MNYEALNQYVLIAIGLFAVLLYIGLVWAGFIEFVAGISKKGESKKCPRSRDRLRNAKKLN